MRYPSVSKFYFMECSGNGLTDWLKNASTTVQQTHGLLSCAQWTGRSALVAARRGRRAAGRQVAAVRRRRRRRPHAQHAAGEGARRRPDRLRAERRDAASRERLSAAAFVPGWEGNVSVKWLRRIKVGDQPWHFRSETARYTDPMPDGKWRQFSMDMECKSVITRAVRRHEARRPGHVRDPGLRVVGQRQDPRGRRHGRRRQELAGSATRGAGAGQMPHPLPLPVELGRRAGEDREPRASTAPATCSRRCRTSRRCARSSGSSSITTASSPGRSAPTGR